MIAESLYHNGRYLALAIIAIVSVGLTSFSSMGRQEDPSITPFVAKIQTFFPGASPARVEALISKPLEDALREQAEVREIEVVSVQGVSSLAIEVDYTLSLIEIKRVMSELRDKVDEVAKGFPPGASPPDFDDDLMTQFVKIVAISARQGETISPAVLRREALNFADAARQVPNTRRVRAYGLPDEAVRVNLDADRLARLGLTIDQVAQSLRASDVRTPAGRLTDPEAALALEISGEFSDIETIRNSVIRSMSDGRTLRVRDIATVVKGETDPPSRIAFSNGRRSVLVAVEMQRGYRVDRYSDDFDEFFDAYKADAAHHLNIDLSFDQSIYTENRLAKVAGNLLAGIALVLLVLLVTLGWRAASVVAVMLPLCSLASMIILQFFNIPIHQMSLTGLVVALGLLVDGSIVMADEVRKRLLNGASPVTALQGAVGRMQTPLLASTLTTLLTFLPMVLLPGPAGDFLGALSISVVVMLGTSFVLAVTITPVLSALWLPSGLQATPAWWQTGARLPRLSQRFSRSLEWSLKHPLASVFLALVLPMIGFVTYPSLGAQFFPLTERNQFYIQVTLPDSAGIDDTRDLVLKMDATLRNEPLVDRVDWTVGESAPAFYYNMRSNKRGVAGWSEGLVMTHDGTQTDALIRRLQLQFDHDHPQAQVIIRGIDQGPPVDAPVEVVLFGPSPEVLQTLGEVFRQRIESLPDVTHTLLGMPPPSPKVVFELDEVELRRVGLSRTAVAQFIDGALRGRQGGELLEVTERVPVVSQFDRSSWARLDQVTNMLIPVPSSQQTSGLQAVPLASLGSVRLVPNDTALSRKDGERRNEVQAYLTRGVLAAEVLGRLEASLEEDPIVLPEGYHYKFGGDSDERAMVVNDLLGPIGIVTAALLATILLTFNSWRLSGLAFFVCLCSFGLSLLSLAIFRYPLGIQALIGVIGSVGVSINAAIIIITGMQQSADASRGDLGAMREVVMDASRHIVSTTITTFGGFFPLIIETDKFWPPFALAIAGGVLLSTVISFYLVPAMYCLLTRNQSTDSKRAAPMAFQTELAGDTP